MTEEIFRKQIESARKNGFNQGLRAAANMAISWGDQCAGGSGDQIIPESGGRKYGQAYYNLAESILKMER